MPRPICRDRSASAVIRAIAYNCRRKPDTLALDGERSMRWPELARAIDRCAVELERLDTDVIAWQLDDDWRWVVLDLACLASGRTALPLPRFFSDEQLRHSLAAAGCDRIVIAPQRGLGWRPQAPRHRLAAIDADVIETGFEPARGRIPPDTAKITFTSGSTGTPKGVCLSGSLLERVAAGLNERLGQLAASDHIRALPLAVLLENVAGLHRSLLAGARYVLPSPDESAVSGSSNFCSERLAAIVERYSPQIMITTPHMLEQMATSRRSSTFARLDFVAVGGAPLPLPVLHAARAAGIAAYEGYGLSECGSVVSLNVPGDDRPGSVGRALPHVSVSSPAGEIVVSGAGFNGYLGGPSRAATPVATGDIGHCDEQRRLWIEGRRDNRIVTPMGRNVSPEWIESKIAGALPGRPFCVVADTDGPAVVVVASHKDLPHIDAKLCRVNAQLPDYARIRRRIVAEEPFTEANGCLTANGRLRRDTIRTRFAANAYTGAQAMLVHGDGPDTSRFREHDSQTEGTIP